MRNLKPPLAIIITYKHELLRIYLERSGASVPVFVQFTGRRPGGKGLFLIGKVVTILLMGNTR